MATGSLHINRDIILATKRHHIRERERVTPMEAVLALAQMQNRPRHLMDIVEDDSPTKIAIIGQVTRSEHYDPVTTAMRWYHMGAHAISFFTDNSIYHHDLEDMLIVARAVKKTPIIYSNYIVNEYGVVSARGADASALMLYASIAPREKLRSIVSLTQRWKMTTFVQVSNPEDVINANDYSPHVYSVGDPEKHSTHQAIAILKEVRQFIPRHTKIMLAPPILTADEIEAAIAAKVDALLLSESVLDDPESMKRVCELLPCNPQF